MRRYRLFLVVAYCAGLFWLSSNPSPEEVPDLFPGQDKVVHAVLYAGLAAVVSFWLRRPGGTPSGVVLFWLPIAFACLYGISDEVHQAFVPTRSADIWDWVADTVGAALYQVAFLWVRQKKMTRSA
jgi:VanZ family protein